MSAVEMLGAYELAMSAVVVIVAVMMLTKLYIDSGE